jgi:hypothetical protein
VLTDIVVSSVPGGNVSVVLYIRPQALLSISFPVHYSLIVLLFDSTYSELITMS